MAKIAIVLHDLRGGGAEKMMVRLANQLALDGDDVEMILITGGGVNKPFLSKKVKLTELNSFRTLKAFGPLTKALKVCKPDAILSALTHINVITSIVCFRLGWLKRLSVSERNAFSLDKSVNSNKIMRMAYLLAPYIYRMLPNPVIAVSMGVAKDLCECTVVRLKDVTAASNPVITEETINASKEMASHPWLVDKDLPVIVSVGRLSHQKGFDMLIDAFYRCEQSIPCRLIIFGEGELKDSLQEQVNSLSLNDKISFAGYVNNPIAEVKQADLYVLSSRFEGSPNAIVEAMSVNTRVVAFDCPHGAREILKDGDVAPLVDNKDVNALALSMLDELKKADQPVELSEAVSRFSAANSAKEYRRLLLKNEN